MRNIERAMRSKKENGELCTKDIDSQRKGCNLTISRVQQNRSSKDRERRNYATNVKKSKTVEINEKNIIISLCLRKYMMNVIDW